MRGAEPLVYGNRSLTTYVTLKVTLCIIGAYFSHPNAAKHTPTKLQNEVVKSRGNIMINPAWHVNSNQHFTNTHP
jgi:hypothetical protein